MDIKKSIEELAFKRGRAVAKVEPIYESESAARAAESNASAAKDPKDFEKHKKDCLSTIATGEKAGDSWKKEMDGWDAAIKSVEAEIATERGNIEAQQKEAAAVDKAIDDINAEIKAYNDSLLLGEHDPRSRPYFAKKSIAAKLGIAHASLAEAMLLAQAERQTWKNQEEWVNKPIKALKALRDSMSKAKFKPSK